MANSQSPDEFNNVEIAIITGGLLWAIQWLPPLVMDDEIQPFTALVYVFAIWGCLRLLGVVLIALACFFEWLGNHAPTDKEGSAGWAKIKNLRAELSRKRQGPFWGLTADRRGKPLFINYASNSMTVSPAGSGKGITTVIPNGFSIRESKVFGDFKGELACILKEPLEARGETVHILNPGGLWKEIIGEGDSYNPLDIITDDLHRSGGLRDVPDDLRELTAQILPEPAETEGDNTYWREGSRRAIADAILLEVMIEEYDATLSSVALLIEDREAFEHNLRWLVGMGLDGKPLPDGPMPIEQTEWAQNHDPEDVAEFIKLVRSRASNWLSLMEG